MAIYNYLLLIPESLVISMLEPESFGTYLATGTKKRAREIALYFDLKSDFKSDYFNMVQAARDCVHILMGPRKARFMSRLTGSWNMCRSMQSGVCG